MRQFCQVVRMSTPFFHCLNESLIEEIERNRTWTVKRIFKCDKHEYCKEPKFNYDMLPVNYRKRHAGPLNVSCPHEENMRYLHIPKLTVCLICMKPLSLLGS